MAELNTKNVLEYSENCYSPQIRLQQTDSSLQALCTTNIRMALAITVHASATSFPNSICQTAHLSGRPGEKWTDFRHAPNISSHAQTEQFSISISV